MEEEEREEEKEEEEKEGNSADAGKPRRHPEARRGLTVCVGVGHLLVCHHPRCGVVHLLEATNQNQWRAADLRRSSKKTTNKNRKTTSKQAASQQSTKTAQVQKIKKEKKEMKDKDKCLSLGSSSDESIDIFQAS